MCGGGAVLELAASDIYICTMQEFLRRAVLHLMFNRSIPMTVYNVNGIPDRIEGEDRKIVRAGKVLPYDIAAANKITVQELIDMGCNIKQVFVMWGDTPTPNNLIMEGLTGSGLQMLAKVIRDDYVAFRFHGMTWFTLGLTVQDMIELKPSYDTAKLFKVDVPQLIKHGASKHGANFQMHVNWTEEQWKQLGFCSEDYLRSVNENRALSTQQKNHYRQWGPRSSM